MIHLQTFLRCPTFTIITTTSLSLISWTMRYDPVRTRWRFFDVSFLLPGGRGSVDRRLHQLYAICMRTTLNLPDDLVQRAKARARVEDSTLTALIIDGLERRVDQSNHRPLPVSAAVGGLQPRVDWDSLEEPEATGAFHR